MLSISCPMPGCEHATLLGDRNKNIKCVSCQNSYIRESDAPNFLADAPVLEPKPPTTPSFDYGDPSPQEQERLARVDAATAKMGELMLKGWAMLAESCANAGCPGIPLMRKKGSASSVCVFCDPTLDGTTGTVMVPTSGSGHFGSGGSGRGSGRGKGTLEWGASELFVANPKPETISAAQTTGAIKPDTSRQKATAVFNYCLALTGPFP